MGQKGVRKRIPEGQRITRRDFYLPKWILDWIDAHPEDNPNRFITEQYKEHISELNAVEELYEKTP